MPFVEKNRSLAHLVLPDAPASESGTVKAWQEPVTMPSYLPAAPDRNPMFLEKRVYQGSSGRVYPLPFIDRIATEPVERVWQAVHMENEFLRLMILPQIGGRIHVGFDKINGYDFFYRQNVIKPALVGLAGPWISGGVEFNWPQHHRPATFMPVETEIERGSDGSITVWSSDHDPMTRMKGMHGVCLHPGKAYVELKVRLYNRTPFVQSFLWWANVAVKVHEKYQSFFPPDVRFVADHARRALTSFPLSDRPYYGVDYPERARSGVPADEVPSQFVPDGSYPANDLSWYANIPVPTSYMIVGTEQDFFGGYDHAARAGIVHVADHRIAPGKKQWTWGNHDFGYAWDRCLTDSDGPYIELMAGVFTDNQPDFSFLAPWETRTFSQYWYPIRDIGPAQAANLHAALSLGAAEGRVHVGVCATHAIPGARIILSRDGAVLREWVTDLTVAKPFRAEVEPGDAAQAANLSARIEADGLEILRYDPPSPDAASEPQVAAEPHLPEEIASSDELYLTGLHLEQYRHATRRPEVYWQEALRRDAGDARSNNALGLWRLHRGEFAEAEQHFEAVVARLTQRNSNPRDGEPHYNLGLALRFLGNDQGACDAFAKAAWNAAWCGPAYLALAEIDARRGAWDLALDHIQRSLAANPENLNARNLHAMIFRKLGRDSEATAILRDTLARDFLDVWARFLFDGKLPANHQQVLDLAFDLARAGFYEQAVSLLRSADLSRRDGSAPIILYAIADFCQQMGDVRASAEAHRQAAQAPPDYCFPSRLEELVILERAIAANPGDARAPYFLGNFLYDRRRHEEAIAAWERSVERDPQFPTAWRNLGIAYFNVTHDPARARDAFDRAFAAGPDDARVLYERDQLSKRMGEPPQLRLAELERYPSLCQRRDDLTVELATLLNQTRPPARALEVLLSRRFQPWEGGEGLVLAQFTRAHLLLGQRALTEGDAASACRSFAAIPEPPPGLGEARHLLANQSDVWFWLGAGHARQGDRQQAEACWMRATRQRGDFCAMSVRAVSEMTFWSAMACQCLGKKAEAAALFRSILDYAEQLERQAPKIDYFATSLPAMLLFEDDLEKRNRIEALYLRGQAFFGLGKTAEAVRCFHEVLELDRNHAGAADLLEQIGWLRGIAGLE
jgi:tetratricopeptide (TPR) repeat protein